MSEEDEARRVEERRAKGEILHSVQFFQIRCEESFGFKMFAYWLMLLYVSQ